MRRKVALAAMVMLAGCETMPLPGYEDKVGTGGRIEVLDPAATTDVQRFYRVVLFQPSSPLYSWYVNVDSQSTRSAAFLYAQVMVVATELAPSGIH